MKAAGRPAHTCGVGTDSKELIRSPIALKDPGRPLKYLRRQVFGGLLTQPRTAAPTKQAEIVNRL
jgi:hypothetical protein